MNDKINNGMGDHRKGVVYLAFGNAYLAMALTSLVSLRQLHPDMPVCIITNVCEEPRDILIEQNLSHHLRWEFVSAGNEANRQFKTRLDRYTPFEKTVFLDCDTLVFADISDLFYYLEYFDVACVQRTHAQVKPGKGDIKILEDRTVSDLPHWNSGVIAFRNTTNAAEFFEEWNKAHNRIGAPVDQVSLVEAVFLSNTRFLSLDKRWNFQGTARNRAPSGAKIVHYTPGLTRDVADRIAHFDQRITAFTGHSDGTTEVYLRDKLAKQKRKDRKRRTRWLRDLVRKFR